MSPSATSREAREGSTRGTRGAAGARPGSRAAARRRRGRAESGQALAEMAMVIPALLLLVFGIIEFGAAWKSYQVVTNAAREGARRAVMAKAGLVDPGESAVLQIVEDVMTSGGLDFQEDYVTFSCDGVEGSLCDAGSRGAAEEVRIDYPYDFFLVGPLADLACVGCDGGDFGTITLTASSVMRSEG